MLGTDRDGFGTVRVHPGWPWLRPAGGLYSAGQAESVSGAGGAQGGARHSHVSDLPCLLILPTSHHATPAACTSQQRSTCAHTLSASSIPASQATQSRRCGALRRGNPETLRAGACDAS